MEKRQIYKIWIVGLCKDRESKWDKLLAVYKSAWL